MKKLILGVICIGSILMFSGCSTTGISNFYDGVGKPTYKAVKGVVKVSPINPKTKARLKELDSKAVLYDTIRDAVKNPNDVE